MEITILGVLGTIISAGVKAMADWSDAPEVAKQHMLEALDSARDKIMSLPTRLAADDAAADQLVHEKFDKGH